jgi:glycosyltransferase involved in cell wall biosynthesis
MKILQALTYYRPHTSGLTIYVERLSKALAAHGHEVTVLTSQYDRSFPREEVSDQVRIVRVPVSLRVSKGVIMPTFGLVATRLVRSHDLIHLHLPQLDAAGVALRGRIFGKPSIITYHCDLLLPAGLFNRIVNQVVHLANHIAARLTNRMVTYTQDYADHSQFLHRYRHKIEIVSPPVELPRAAPEEVAELARRHNHQGRRPVIGMATRLASEKGVEVLLDALPTIIEQHPDALVLFAGQHEEVLGEDAYRERLARSIETHQQAGRWVFTGILSPLEMSAFYSNLDLLVVPSLNSTESFGLVQIEAMMHGVPVVASDLPGVRQPVSMTGMGEIAAVGSSESLAQTALKVLAEPARYSGDPEEVAARFAPATTANAYEALYKKLLQSTLRIRED